MLFTTVGGGLIVLMRVGKHLSGEQMVMDTYLVTLVLRPIACMAKRTTEVDSLHARVETPRCSLTCTNIVPIK